MPWLKSGDNAATHPIVMRVTALVARCQDHVLERDVALNEVAGFVMRCALQSAGHTTDYVIDMGTAYMIGQSRTERLLELARRAGYLTRTRDQHGQQAWALVQDPDFLHMRLRAEIDWEKQQRADNADPALIVPVRLRDGDACRYCGHTVNFRARKGGRRGTYDHRVPGQAATIATLVVACGACNEGRRDRDDADDRYPLRPEPDQPYYSPTTAAWLADHGHHVTPSTDDQRPPSQGDTATGDPAASRIPPLSDRPARATPRPPAITPAPVDGSADHLPTGSGSAGSGRVGSGHAQQFHAGTAAARGQPGRRRSARGRPRRGGST